MFSRTKINKYVSFYIRLLLLIMVVCFLLIDLIVVIKIPMHRQSKLTLSDRASNYYFFFTTQTNYMVAVYFASYLYTATFKKRIPNFPLRLAVTVYITVTMLVFWLGIFTNTAENHINEYEIYNWVNTIILHLIMPISMIISFILTSGQENINFKKWHHNYLWLIALYPILYCIVILIRGYLRYLDYLDIGYPPPDTWFPYTFFNPSLPNAIFVMVGAFFLIFGLVFSLQYLYIWLNNWKYEHYPPEEDLMEIYYRRTISKINKRRKQLTKTKNKLSKKRVHFVNTSAK